MYQTLPSEDDLSLSPETIHVLHVDDEPSLADLVGTFLERENDALDVESVTTPHAARTYLEDHHVDCIVSDYEMPGMNGIELLTEIRTQYPDLPFILFTGKGSEEVASGAISAGVTDYMQKESGTDQYQVLANRISNVVNQARAEDRVHRGYQAIETAREGISLVGEDGCFRYVNQAYASVYGYEREEMIGENWRLLYREEDIEDAEEIIANLEANETWTGETNGVTKDGEVIVEQHSLTRTGDGGLACTVRDITNDKQREETLRTLHSVTRELMEAQTPAEVSRIAVETLEQVLGHPVNGVWLYQPEQDALVPVAYTDTAAELLDQIPTYRSGNSLSWRVFETGETRIFDNVHDSDDVFNPKTLIKSEAIVPLGNQGVLNVGSQTTSNFDDTDLRFIETLAANLETALKRTERERTLREEKIFTENIIGALGDVLYVFDADNRLIRWNQQLQSVTGYTSSELAGKHITEFAPDCEADRLQRSIEAMESGESVRLKIPLVTKGGDQILHEFTRTKLTDEDGEILGICGIGRDISDQETQRQELKRQNERLERFASAVSHDLRSPLTVAEGRIELASELVSDIDVPASEPVERELQNATDALERMDSLIEDVLTLAREGRTIDELEQVDLDVLVRDAWTDVSTNYEGASLIVEENLRTIDADGGRLRQVVENLLCNAAKYGGPNVEITVFRDSQGLHVADNGPGIPADEREDVLTPGYSTDQSSTGFGLAIVSDIVEAHGWDMQVTESESGGAQFSIIWE